MIELENRQGIDRDKTGFNFQIEAHHKVAEAKFERQIAKMQEDYDFQLKQMNDKLDEIGSPEQVIAYLKEKVQKMKKATQQVSVFVTIGDVEEEQVSRPKPVKKRDTSVPKQRVDQVFKVENDIPKSHRNASPEQMNYFSG